VEIGGQKGRQTKDHKLFGKDTVSGLKEVQDFSKTVAEAGKGFKDMNTTAKAMFSSIAQVEEGLSNSALYSEKNKKSHSAFAKEAEKMIGKGRIGLGLQKMKLKIKEKLLGQDHSMSKSMIDQLNQIRKGVPLRAKILDNMKAAEKALKGQVDNAKALDNALGGIGQSIVGFIMNPFTILVALITFAIKMFTRFSKVTDMIGQDFGYMATQSKELQERVSVLNKEGAHLDVNYDKFKQHIGPIAEGLGVGAMEAINLAAQSEKLGIALGIGGAEAAKLKMNFEIIAGVSRDITDDYLKQATALAEQAGVVPSFVMKDVANSSEMMAKYTKDGGKNILTAAINAKKFGVNLAAVEKITDSLLDIETSINKEFEASVMIGKQLNFQTARQKALQGDVSGAVEDVVGQLGGAAEFAKLDVLQRKSLAGAIGLSVTELSKFMNKQGEVNNMAKVTGEEMSKANIEDIKAENAISGVTQTTNAIKNMQDTITSGLIPEFQKLNTWLAGEDGEGGIVGSITKIGERLAMIGENLPFIGAGFMKMASKLKFLAKGIAKAFSKTMSNVAKGLKGGITSMAKGLKSGLGGLLSKGKGLFGKIGGMFKGAGKWLKKVPVLGSVVGVAAGVGRAIKGDWAGAGLEFASAGANALNLVAPGAGTAASLALDASIVARDAGMWGNAPGAPAEDFVLRPGQPPLRFSKGDLVMGVDSQAVQSATGGGFGGGGLTAEDLSALKQVFTEGTLIALNKAEPKTIVSKEDIRVLQTNTV
jgi:DNA-binding Lrp family transcriptional regulator|tara:strand:+ start:1771 stop:4053 length:2283 start_codon:yes stop_codon:yes gene_type:complete